MNDLDLCLEVVSRSCQPLRCIRRWISRKPLEIEAWFQRTTNGKWHMGIKWSRDWWHVTPKGQTRDPNTLRAQYLENSWRCYIATIANYSLVCCEGSGSTVGYPSDSLAACSYSSPFVIVTVRSWSMSEAQSVWLVAKNPPYGFLFFPKRMAIFNQFFTHLLHDHLYTRLQFFIQISATLTKLCHTKRDHLANFYISLEL